MEISVPMMLIGLAAIAAAGSLCGWWLEPGRAGRRRMRTEREAPPRAQVRRICEDTEADGADACSRPAA